MKHWTEEDGSFANFVAEDLTNSIKSNADTSYHKWVNTEWLFNRLAEVSLKLIVDLVRAANLKLAIFAYDDDDPNNERGPIFAEIFLKCWEHLGKPRDFKQLEEATK
jgi:hypothetical protein